MNTTPFYDASGAEFNEEDQEPIAITYEEYSARCKELETELARGLAARRLADNPDFMDVVMTGFFNDDVNRLSGLITSGKTPATVQDRCFKEMQGIAVFKAYLYRLIEEAAATEDELASLKQDYDMSIIN